MITAKWTPNFDTKEIYSEWIQRDWFIFQSEVYELGTSLLSYMQEFIAERTHRDGATGNLARSIKLYHFGGFAQAEIGWGLGLMSEMDKLAPYWYLVNYGGHTFASAFKQGVGGHFHGFPPQSILAGSGVGDSRFTWSPYTKGSFVMFPKNPIKPMHYIEAGMLTLNNEIINLLNKIQTSGMTSNLPRLGKG